MTNPIVKIFRSKLNTAVVLLILVLIIGVFGFKIISDFSWLDAVYMTVITVTTVGFGEVQPLDQESKLFTIILILMSVIIVGYALKIITEYIISKNDINELKQKKMQKKIDALSDHVIICGYGRNGKQAANKLATHHRDFVVIEKDEQIVQKHKDTSTLFILGNANEDEVLLRAGINRACCLISALPNDSENVFVVLSARQMNPDIRIISRASQETTYSKLKLAGANNVILPDRIGGDHMASLVVVPDLLEFVDNLSIIGNQSINIEEVAVEQLYDTSKQKTILELDLRKKTGCNVIGYKDENGNYHINPEADQKLVPGSKVIVLGRPEQIQTLNSMYNIEVS
ncbi:MAG: potassium channel protein [Bacteroidetes bacterium]|nr:potassium channel protein [Bacteroidota bacterium]MDA0860152.1 potassium channel protein [Bacteroidota bacterium]MDA1318249.1 potassium channel protein [Bacteroidota bacterium]